MDLSNIQMQIVLAVQGMAELGALQNAMQGVYGAAGRLGTQQEAQATRQGRFNNLLGSWGAHLNDVERSYDAIFRAGMHMVMLGSQLNQFFHAGVGLVTNATAQWGTFQTQLIKTANSIGGIVEGTPMWNALAQAVEGAAVQLGVYNPTQVAEALYFWEGATGATIKSQKDLQTQLQAMAPVMEMAYMKNLDMKTAVYGVEGAMRMFHMDVSQTGDVVAIFTSLVNKNAFELGDLVSALKMVGPIADTMHMSLAQVATVMAGMADAGIRGSQAGQILRMELLKIEHPSKAASKALDALFQHTKGLGKSFNSIVFPGGKFEGYTKYINDMAIATMNLTDLQKGQLLGTIGTAREVSGLVRAIDNAQRAMKGLGTQTGATTETLAQAKQDFATGWDNVTKSWAYMTGQFQNAILPIIYAIGANAQATLGPLIQMATKFLIVIGDWVNNNPQLVQLAERIGGVLVVAAGLAGALFSVLGSLTLLAAGIGVVLQGFGGVLLVFGVFGGIVAALVAAIVSNVGGMRDAVMNFVDALSGFFSALIGGNDKFKASWNDVATTVASSIEPIASSVAAAINRVSTVIRNISHNPEAMNFLREFGKILAIILGASLALRVVGAILGPVIGAFKPVIGLLSAGFKAAGWVAELDIVKSAFLSFRRFLTTSLLGPIMAVFDGIAAAIGIPVGIVIGAFVLIVAAIAAYVTNFMGFRDKVNAFIDWVAGRLKGPVASIVGVLERLWQPIGDLVSKYGPTALAALGRLANTLMQTINQVGATILSVWQNNILPAIATVGNALLGAWNTIKPAFDEFAKTLSQFLPAAWDVLASIIVLGVGAVGGAILGFVKLVVPVLGTLATFLIRTLGVAFQTLANIVSDVIGFIATFIRSTLQILTNVMKALMDAAKGNWSNVWHDILNILTAVWNVIVSSVTTFISIVLHVITGTLQTVLSVFEGIFGLKPGSIYATIGGAIANITTVMGRVTGAIISAITGAIPGILHNAGNIAVSIINAIQNGLGFAGGVFKTIVDIGKNIVYGIWSGIQGLASWLVTQLTAWVKNVIPGPIAHALGIKSPSRVMAEIGKNIVQGLAVGISSNTAAVSAMRAHSNALLMAAKEAQMSASGALSGYGSGAYSFSTSSDRVLRVAVDVTSSDGSVDKLKAADISNALQGSELVKALTHMATVS